MLLGFMRKFSGKGLNKLKNKPTMFRERIMAGRKIHTMRIDVHSRWRVGMMAQMCYGVRTTQFEKIKNIQVVEFIYKDKPSQYPVIKIDGRTIGVSEIILLAMCDGFDDLAEFFEYFKEDGTYRLLHWTDFVYDGKECTRKLIEFETKYIREQVGKNG